MVQFFMNGIAKLLVDTSLSLQIPAKLPSKVDTLVYHPYSHESNSPYCAS